MQDPVLAFYYYLQARAAIRMRRKAADYYGDEQVETSIENAIRAVLPHTPFEKPEKDPVVPPEELLWQAPMDAEDYFVLKITDGPGGRADVRLTRNSWETEAPLFVTVPAAHFSEAVRSLHYSVEKKGRWTMKGGKTLPSGAKTLCFDGIENDEFYLNGEKVAHLPGEWKLLLPRRKNR